MCIRDRDRKCRVLHAFVREQTDLYDLCELIEQDIHERFNSHDDFRFWLDPAGSRGNGQGTEVAADVIYNYFGKPVDWPDLTKPEDRVRIMNDFFSNDMIEIAPNCGEYIDSDRMAETSAFIFMLTTGYYCDHRGKPVKDRENKWNHFADAWGYGFICVFCSARDISRVAERERFSVRPDYFDKRRGINPKKRQNYLIQ